MGKGALPPFGYLNPVPVGTPSERSSAPSGQDEFAERFTERLAQIDAMLQQNREALDALNGVPQLQPEGAADGVVPEAGRLSTLPGPSLLRDRKYAARLTQELLHGEGWAAEWRYRIFWFLTFGGGAFLKWWLTR